jgi:hypothetical protein
MTLAELMISMAILGMISVVLAGMSHAVNMSWNYTKGVEETELQASAALERIKFMVSQVGAYRVAGQPTRLGLAGVMRTVGNVTIPDTLMLWTGGRDGGMAALGTQARWPLASEVLVYTWNPSNPKQLVEAAFPGNTTVIDFASTDLANTVAQLINLSSAERIPLCDRLRVSTLTASSSVPSSPTVPPTSMMGSMGSTAPAAPVTTDYVGNVRFQVNWTPSDIDLSMVSPATSAWMQLGWSQSVVSSRSGLRQATVNIEMQIEPRDSTVLTDDVTAVPFFGSASTRYVYEP